MRPFVLLSGFSLLACTLGAEDTASGESIVACEPVAETCNAIDDDCDGNIDNNPADPSAWYADDDADTYGDMDESVTDCAAPAGFVADNTDCDDANVAINPAVEESGGNEVDENCDGEVLGYCGIHAPVVTLTNAEYDPEFSFGDSTAPALVLDVTMDDQDGDLFVASTHLWIDTSADGIVDTSGAATFEFSPYTFDRDDTCDEVQTQIQYAVEITEIAAEASEVDVAVKVADAVGHWSEAVVVSLLLE